MTILRDVSAVAWSAPRFAPGEEAAMAGHGGRLPMAALEFGDRDWRIAGRSVAAPLAGARLDRSVWFGGGPGLLLEPERSNLVFPSAIAPGGWSTNGGTSIAAATGSGFGGLAGARIASGTTTWGRAYGNRFTLGPGAYRATVWIAWGSSGRARIELYGTGLDLVVDGEIGALAASYQSGGTVANLEQVDLGGVWRVGFDVSIPTSRADVSFGLGPASGIAGEDVVGYAAQIEAGSGATGLIPTTDAVATRPADAPSMSLGPWFSPARGAAYIELDELAGAASGLLAFEAADGTALAAISCDAAGTLALVAGATSITHPDPVGFGQAAKIGLRWEPAGAVLQLDGIDAAGAAVDLGGAARLRLGPAHGLVRRCTLFDRAV
ncbi:hypothetical protein OG2516_05693 [Oceanicola granulosus HTCC2516]|uniref:Uncharacterized protein n=1 Tax=Oceanicola granulosus (strain ATCC BAA-861 / DSM 15982 / KCTC 12143 / HTCC2516) TaxID=314256 RepID=Q2CIL3_OCEGH|nr:hypothetical protein [Oceanicola granulosus]EAR52576.1 hypothetical protein OG2516_05693 [Oceanicola granulosus HTCC2516]